MLTLSQVQKQYTLIFLVRIIIGTSWSLRYIFFFRVYVAKVDLQEMALSFLNDCTISCCAAVV